MSGPTPGPWKVWDTVCDEPIECPGIEADGGVSIVVFGKALTDAEVCGVQGRTVAEAAANARLIAASPDLKDALPALIALVEDERETIVESCSLIGTGSDGEPTYDESTITEPAALERIAAIDAALAPASAALAKADGE